MVLNALGISGIEVLEFMDLRSSPRGILIIIDVDNNNRREKEGLARVTDLMATTRNCSVETTWSGFDQHTSSDAGGRGMETETVASGVGYGVAIMKGPTVVPSAAWDACPFAASG